MAEKKFVSLSRLIRINSSSLTHEQRRLVESHEEAKQKWDAFTASKKPRLLGIAVALGQLSSTSTEELDARSAALAALKPALLYYARHGGIERAYADLKRHAEQHWHPVVSEQWPHHFITAAEKLRLPLLGKSGDQARRDRVALLRDMVDLQGLASASTRRKGKLH